MTDIKTLIFSKNRALQLMSLLESYSFYADGIDNTSIITPSLEDYKDHQDKFPTTTWIDERQFGGFGLAFEDFFQGLHDDDLILLIVDDFVFTRPINLNICNILQNKKLDKVASFSLRLGTNVAPYHKSWNVSSHNCFSIMTWLDKPLDYGHTPDRDWETRNFI